MLPKQYKLKFPNISDALVVFIPIVTDSRNLIVLSLELVFFANASSY